MAFPPAHFLVGCGVAEVVRGFFPRLPRSTAWMIAGCLAVSPDLDFGIGMLLGRTYEYHGTFTHSIVAALAIGVTAWLLAGRAWGVLAGMGYASHLLVDLLDDRGRTNVLLGWPFTLEQPMALARVFPTIPFEQGRGVLAAALSLLEPAALRQLALQTALGAVALVLLLLLAACIRRGAAILHPAP